MSEELSNRTQAATGSASLPPPGAAATMPVRGELVGRYLVLDRIGAGAMGVVFAAYDPELDRKVALKLLLGGGEGDVASSRDAQRLRREAQALARLSHPGVVAVHDVGTHGAHVFVAMEYVDGVTLTRWATSAPRSAREIVAVMIEAGRGLAAAHAAGLLHRDFKPDNVMIDRELQPGRGFGRVRVLDFGLARARERAAAMPATSTGVTAPLDATAEGAIVGTPAYMAPEQLAGLDLDARADQFSFAVTLWELLYGVRPFRGASLAELAAAVLDGRVSATPPGARVPAWLRAVVLRALAGDPAARHASVEALLAALARDPTRRRRQLAAAIGGIAIAGGAVIGSRVVTGRRIEACAAEQDAALDGVWHAGARASIHEILEAAPAGLGETTWSKLEPRLDAYALAWREAARAQCRSGVERPDDPQRRDAEICLQERRGAFAALLGSMQGSGTSLVATAVPSAIRLPRVESCADPQYLAQHVMRPDDPELAAATDPLYARLAEVTALQEVAAYAEADDEARTLLQDAGALGFRPLIAQSELRAGIVAGLVGNRTRKAELLRAAYYDGAGAGIDEVAYEAAQALVFAEGNELGRGDAALEWGRHASMILDRMGEPPQSLRRAAVAAAIGIEYDSLGRWDEALTSLTFALEIRERELGPEHPDVGATLGGIGLVHYARADYARARPLLERALSLREQTLGAEHPVVALALNNLGMVELAQADYAAARDHLQRALALIERDQGREHPNVAIALNNLGVALRDLGALDDAVAAFERAEAIWAHNDGPDLGDRALALDNLGTIARMRHDYDRAAALHRQALEVRERALGPRHRDVGVSLYGLGKAEAERGRVTEATALLERALAVLEHDADAHLRGQVRGALARAIVDGGGDPVRARQLATVALTELRSVGVPAQDEATALAQWLERQP
ncbi:MAG: serine/threonine-protein kinase [Nannocystaceae bacterium]|nr:serine/threonine-protein kinase [Nannocystaceae bacterium]